MAKIKLKFLVQDIDRYGHVRTYVRIKGIAKIRIREPFGTDEFMTAYHAAIAGKKDDGTKQYQRAAKGSFGATCLAYYASQHSRCLTLLHNHNVAGRWISFARSIATSQLN
jgi:hypothetical protein